MTTLLKDKKVESIIVLFLQFIILLHTAQPYVIILALSIENALID